VSGEWLVERLRECKPLHSVKNGRTNSVAIGEYVREAYEIRHEAADALTTAEARIQELEAALAGAVRAMEAEATVLRTAGYAPSCAEALTRKAKIAREIIARRTLRGE